MKLVINRAWGGFHLSTAAMMAYAKRKGLTLYAVERDRDAKGYIVTHGYKYAKPPTANSLDEAFVMYTTAPLGKDGAVKDDSFFSERDIERTDPDLIAVVEELGDAANTSVSVLKVIEIPDGTDYEIEDYDGMETVHEKHRSWS